MRLCSRLFAAAAFILSGALAWADGIHNPSASTMGDFDGIVSSAPASGSTLACTYTPVTTGTQNVAYTGATPSASGGVPAYTFSETGALPSGLTISSSTGVISGTPSVSGTFTGIQVKVTDTALTVANCGASFTLVIAASGAAYTFAGSADNNGGVGNTWTVSTINIGPAVASRLVVVCLAIQNNPTLTVTVNGVSLTQAAVDTTTNQAALWYGSVPSGSGAATIVVTGGNFLLETMLVYYATGLASNTPRATTNGHVGGAAGSLAVSSGDFIFAAASAGNGQTSAVWTGSTQTPTGTQSDITQSAVPGFTADWIVSSTGTFSTVITTTGGQYAAANWR